MSNGIMQALRHMLAPYVCTICKHSPYVNTAYGKWHLRGIWPGYEVRNRQNMAQPVALTKPPKMKTLSLQQAAA